MAREIVGSEFLPYRKFQYSNERESSYPSSFLGNLRRELPGINRKAHLTMRLLLNDYQKEMKR